MKAEIIKNLNKPVILERLYRDNKARFKSEFDFLYPEIKGSMTAQIWNARLNFENKEIFLGARNEIFVVALLSFIAGLIAKLPDFTGMDQDYFYPRNFAFVVFPSLVLYFAWRETLQLRQILVVSGTILASVIYINILPDDSQSDTLILACIHLPLFLWALLGYTFTGNQFRSAQKRIDFLRYNGDLVVMTTVILIAGGILSAVTVGLFGLIQLNIEEFYFSNIAIWGLASAPIVGTFLVRSNPQLVKNVSPIIARIFTPLVLVMLVTYLVAMIYTGKDPYNDREFLLIFNLLLIGVMAIILFALTEITKSDANRIGVLLLLILSMVTMVINGIALSAIVFRISEWGITPNRLAVLGGNLLIISNLGMVSYRLSKSVRNLNALVLVEDAIALFLPVYTVWTIIVVFGFPLFFGFE